MAALRAGLAGSTNYDSDFVETHERQELAVPGRSIRPFSWSLPKAIAPVLCLGLAFSMIPQRAAIAEEANFELDEYRLAAQDKLRISVLQWMPGAGNYQQWTALNGEYLVGSSGTISMPLLGMIPAANLTTSELSTTIAKRLKLRAGLGIDPDVSVEILQYRPIYVVGQVQTPGEYSFRPGLTTTKALALAGGVYREGVGRSREIERINAQSAFDDAQLQLRRALVRRARLHAELDELNRDKPSGGTFAVPSDLKDGPTADRLIRDEEIIKNARMTRLASQIAASEELIRLYRNEDAALESKIALQRQNRDLAREENEKINRLREKDLVVNSRWLSTQLALAEHEARLLDLETASLRIKQELSKAERAIIDVKSDLRTSITNELQQVESSIDLLRSRSEAALALLAEAQAPYANALADTTLVDPKNAESARAKAVPVVTYSIIRQTGDRSPQTIVADANTKVLPGDVINVAVVPADQLPAEQLNLSSNEPVQDPSDEPSEKADDPISLPPPGQFGSLTGNPARPLMGQFGIMRDY